MLNNMKEFKVKSSSSNNVYIVRHFEETDKWTCTCPSYIFHNEDFQCKHIKEIIASTKNNVG
jgi:hypothetical protein